MLKQSTRRLIGAFKSDQAKRSARGSGHLIRATDAKHLKRHRANNSKGVRAHLIKKGGMY
jgi:hypothetical protein